MTGEEHDAIVELTAQLEAVVAREDQRVQDAEVSDRLRARLRTADERRWDLMD